MRPVKRANVRWFETSKERRDHVWLGND